MALMAMGLLSLFCAVGMMATAVQMDSAGILKKIDAAVKTRVDGIAVYTVTEHYAVFRNNDETHPAAQMTVETTYKQDTGKSYAILSQSGSAVIRSLVLGSILDNEKHVNEPGVREGSWLTTANYEMTVQPGGIQKKDGRDCIALTLAPRRRTPYLLEGTLWVDATSGNIVRIEGRSSKSSSLLTGPTQMMRQYTDIDGFAEATHARAESDTFLFGRTVVTIDYRDYQIQLGHGQ